MSDLPLRRYSPLVRMGNWFEETTLIEESRHTFKQKQGGRKLMVEKADGLKCSLFKPATLYAAAKWLHFGDVVQVMPQQKLPCTNEKVESALSIVANERAVRRGLPGINDSCELSVAICKEPLTRNSFRIVSPAGRNHDKETLKYGQHFRLQCVESQDDEPVFVYSMLRCLDSTNLIRPTFETYRSGETNLPVGLVGQKNVCPGKAVLPGHTVWACQYQKPQYRFEKLHTEVPYNTPVIITHIATNRNLAYEDTVVQTMYGTEYLVSCQNYRDRLRREHHVDEPKNVWIFSSGKFTHNDSNSSEDGLNCKYE